MRRSTTIGLYVAGIAGLGLAFAGLARAEDTEPTPAREPITRELPAVSPAELREALCWAIPRVIAPDDEIDLFDVTDRGLVIRQASFRLFGADVRGDVAGDHPTVAKRLDELRDALSALAADPGACLEGIARVAAVEPVEPPLPTVAGVDDGRGRTVGAVEDAPAPAPLVATAETWDPPNMAAETKSYPTGGAFYQVKVGDQLLGDKGIVHKWLTTEAFLAARDQGETDSASRRIAATAARAGGVRMAAYDLLLCVPWVDALFCSYQVGGKAFPLGPTGRGLVMFPIHADTAKRLSAGDSPIRNVTLGRPGEQGNVLATAIYPELAKRMPLLWLPPLDRPALLVGRVEVSATPWSLPAGSALFASRIHPPPAVQAADILFASDQPAMVWGCPPHALMYG